MIKLALTDLDDTLIKNGLPRATDHALAAIHAMIDEGLHFGPVSGRIPKAMGWMFGNDEACYQTGALSNGQMVYIDGELVHAEAIDSALLMDVAATLTELGGACLCMYDVSCPNEDDSGYFVSPSERHLAWACDTFRHIKGSATELPKPTYIKANVWTRRDDHDYVLFVRDTLRDKFADLDFVLPSPTAPLIDISPAGWNKGSATRYLADELGLTLDEVATFGDSENDLSMLEVVPNSVSVANASDTIKAATRWHIGESADDAVADALFEIARAAQAGTMPAFMQE
jgi:Cof subfamily protein (haloacid dehalogenase superfamily)